MSIETIRKLKENAGQPKPKKNYVIPKKSAKKIAKEKVDKEERGGGDTELQKWYRARMKQMTGYCSECHAKTETHIYQYAVYSICHILAKRPAVCPSVATHPQNWIELCPDCHREFDTPPFEKDKTIWDKREEMGFWNVVRDKLVMVYPNIAEDEKRHFPESVLRFMERNNPFPEK